MKLRDRFDALTATGCRATPAELDELFAAADSVGIAFMLGEWDGAHFAQGHPIEKQLDAIRWAGKSFTDRDTVSPIVCFDEAGGRAANPAFGGARLREMVYLGAVTATMVYDDLPMFDHFRKIDDDTVMGAMDSKGRSRPGYFYLTRRVVAAGDITADVERPTGAEVSDSASAFRPQLPPLFTEAALIRARGGPFSVEQVELEAPRADEVLVRIAASGLCQSDLTVAQMYVAGQSPLVLGHEGAGTVTAVGDEVADLAVGDRVVLSYAWCGRCRNCLRDKMAYCAEAGTLNLLGVRPDGSTGMRQDGRDVRGRFCGQSSFAGYALAAAHTVVRVPSDIPFEVLAPLGCGVQTGAGTVLNSLRPQPGSTLAVFGAGSVGMSAILAARVADCAQIIAVDPRPERRALAVELGASAAFAPGEAKDGIRAVTGSGVDFALDCVGSAEVVRAAVGALDSPGVCATVGVRGKANPIEVDQTKLVGKGQTIRGVVEGDSVPSAFVPMLVDLYRAGRFPVDRMVTTFPFEKINDAVAATREGTAVKAVLTF